MQGRRQERLAGLIKEKVSEVINQVLDKFLNYFVTITDVAISSDNMNVKVSYSVLGGEVEKAKVKELFKKCQSKIRFEVGNRIEFRRVPVFHFEFDETIEKASRIENLLIKLKDENDRLS
jgi:ribosome-binding factor A